MPVLFRTACFIGSSVICSSEVSFPKRPLGSSLLGIFSSSHLHSARCTTLLTRWKQPLHTHTWHTPGMGLVWSVASDSLGSGGGFGSGSGSGDGSYHPEILFITICSWGSGCSHLNPCTTLSPT